MRRASHAVGVLSRLACAGAIALSVGACHPARVVLLVPDNPLAHDIGSWLDEDLICVPLTAYQALYIPRRCVPMRTVRALILQTRFAGARP